MVIEEFILKIKTNIDGLKKSGDEVEKQKRKFADDQKKRDKENANREKKELEHNKKVKKDLLDRIRHTKDLALKITGLGTLFSAVGFAKITDDTLKQADALQFLSKEFGMATSRVKAYQDAARLGGGTAEGMTEALSASSRDVSLYRQGRPFSEIQSAQMLARYGGKNDANIDINWAMASTDNLITAKMQIVDWLSRQSKELFGGIDPKQMASQVAIEGGIGGIMNPLQNYPKFQENLQKREAKAKQWEDPNVRQIREELTGLQLDLETITSSVVLKAFAPEIHKIAKSIGELKPDDVEKIVNSIQRLVNTLDELVTEAYKISQDKDTKEFFKEVGGAVSTTVEAVDGAVTSTIGWKTAIEGLIGLRLLAFFGSLAGVVGLGAGAGVTGAILAAAAAVGVLGLAFMDLQKEDGFIKTFGKQLDESSPKTTAFMEKATESYSRGYEWMVNKTSQGMTALSDLSDKAMGADYAIEKVIKSGAGWVDVQTKSGDIERRTGVRNWRNNNPGNLEYGDFAKSHGAVGTDSRFAVFPDYLTGRNAKESLIFGSKGYKDLNLAQAINKYAPPSENDTQKYTNTVLNAVGGTIKRMGDYTQDERRQIMNAMEKVEGFAEGKIETLMSVKNEPVVTPLELRIKSKEALAGGGTKQGTLDTAKFLQDRIPEFKQVTAADDAFHRGVGYHSKHTEGTAFDFSINGGKNRAAEITQQTREILAAQNIQAKVIDEYNNPSKNATGGHIHVELLKQPVMPIPMPPQLPPAGVKTTNNQTSSNVTMSNVFNIAGENPKATADAVGYKMSEFECFSNEPVNANNSGFKT